MSPAQSTAVHEVTDHRVLDETEVGRYTISEVAARTGLSAHTLRWYERIGLMPHVGRETSWSGERRPGSAGTANATSASWTSSANSARPACPSPT